MDEKDYWLIVEGFDIPLKKNREEIDDYLNGIIEEEELQNGVNDLTED